MMLWTHKNGRFAPVKAFILALLVSPGLWLAARIALNDLGPRPFDELIHECGRFAVWCFMASLAVTPLRKLLEWPQIAPSRRHIGVAAFVYAFVHFLFYVMDQKFDLLKVGSEIVLRFYLTIGFVALLGFAVLAATSTDSAIRRMGNRRWNRLHKIVYGLGILILVHYLLQAKRAPDPATVQMGFFLWLMLYRLAALRIQKITPWMLLPLAAVAGLGAAALETGWFACCTSLPWDRVLQANLMPSFRTPPSYWVFGAALLVALIAFIRQQMKARRLAAA